MSTILFVTWDGGGNLPPELAVAGELARRGHDVRFLGHPAQEPAVLAAGHPFRPYPTARPFSAVSPGSLTDQMHVFGDRAIGRDMVVEAAGADLVVVDCMLGGALAAAARAGLRFAVLEHTYDDYVRRRLLRGPVGLSHAVRGLRPHRSLDVAAATVVTALPDLDPAAGRGHAGRLTHVGPIVTGRPANPSGPTVLVSLSTYGYPGQQETLQRVLDATRPLDARVVVTTGPAIDPASLEIADGVAMHRFLPHAQVMSEASVVIGHGGHGTAMQALAHDLPVVLVPLSRYSDHHLVAGSVVRAGAGRAVRRSAPVGSISEAIGAMLADGPHRAAAARLGARIRSMPGAAGAANRLEGVLRGEAAAPGRRGAPRRSRPGPASRRAATAPPPAPRRSAAEPPARRTPP